MNRTPHPEVPLAPIALSALEPILLLPTDELADLHVMFWSTDGFPTIVNGSSGYNPPAQGELRELVESSRTPAASPACGSWGCRPWS